MEINLQDFGNHVFVKNMFVCDANSLENIQNIYLYICDLGWDYECCPVTQQCQRYLYLFQIQLLDNLLVLTAKFPFKSIWLNINYYRCWNNKENYQHVCGIWVTANILAFHTFYRVSTKKLSLNDVYISINEIWGSLTECSPLK